jgi:hypothetical protein
MAIIDNVNEVLHHIRVKLYPNYLPSVQGTYIAHTDNEASLSIEEVCAALKNRGGFTGNYDDLVAHVKQFFTQYTHGSSLLKDPRIITFAGELTVAAA